MTSLLLSVTYPGGPRDLKRVDRDENRGLGTRQHLDELACKSSEWPIDIQRNPEFSSLQRKRKLGVTLGSSCPVGEQVPVNGAITSPGSD